MKIPRVDLATGAPLSFAQQRLWFLDQLMPGRAIYNFPLTFDVEGPLDVGALQRSLEEIVRRHEALRTRFPSSDGTPRQEITPLRTWDLVLRDVSERPESERRAAAEQIVMEEARRPFDLAEGPVFRTSLIRLSPTSHVLIGNVHHIVIDAWSVGVFLHELMTLYGAYSAGLPSPLADLPIRYIDFSVWQRDALAGNALASQLAYWKDQLRAPRPQLMLPGDRPRPAVQSYRGHREHLVLRDGFFEEVQQFSRREGVTPFITLLAAYGAMLHRLTGQDDIIVGTPIANRLRQEIEPLIGFFVNTLALRLDLSGQPTFRTLLQRAKRVAFAAYSHQDLPFEMLVEELKPERSLGQSPILQALLVLDNTPQTQASQLTAGGVAFKRRMVETGTAKFDLTLLFLRTAAGRRATLEVNADLFERQTGAHLLREFIKLLETVTADADSVIGRLPVAVAAESRAVPASWNNTVRPFDLDQTIAALFEAQAARTPDADAVVGAGEPMSYRALDEESNRLARALRAQGIGPDDRVGISIERSPSLLVGMLAILKAGAAYVPLDATYPMDRLEYIAQDAEIKLLLTSTSLIARLPAGAWKTLCVDPRSQDVGVVSAQRLPPSAGPANLAYVIYTSGSTGRPKGVAVEHRNVVNLISWAHETFTRDELSVMLASTSISFDLSVFELFVPLTSGGSVALVDNLLAVAHTAAASRATFVNTVPSAMTELLRLEALPAAAKVVVLAGEPLPQALVERLYNVGSVERVFDLYGPTETTVYSTGALRARGGAASIGKPIANTTALVLDPSGQVVPIGVPGELYLGGAGVARGYLGRPDLTSERFVPDPTATADDSRMYRTGDRVRWRPDGTLEFMGRLDQQIKLRGYRIELGEIEAALASFPSIRESVVVRREDAVDDVRLVAYVVGEGTLDVGVLHRHLANRLPEYMLPSATVVLDRLPRLPNGKLDRSSLPAYVPDSRDAALSGSPLTPLEESVAGVWRDVLKVPHVGAEDDFFALGGHSLLATQAIARLRSICAPGLGVRAIFQAPTVRGLARLIEEASSAAASSATRVPVSEATRDVASAAGSRAEYWRAQLRPPRGVLDLAFGRSAAAAGIARVDGVLAADAVAGVEAIGHAANATRFMTWLALFSVVLRKWSGVEDLLIGTAEAGIVRANLSGNPSFLELLGRIRLTTMDAQAHALSLDAIVNAVSPIPVAGAPLFQVRFAAEELRASTSGAIPQLDPDQAGIDLSVTMARTEGGAAIAAQYRPARIDRHLVLRLPEQLQALADAVIANPDARLQDLSLAAPAERMQLLEWSGKTHEYPRDASISGLFEAQAARAPNRPAVVGPGGSFTYADLNTRADHLARILHGHGVGRDVVAGLCVERSAEHIVAMLAILKAGGAYLPLDPADPAPRIGTLIDAAHVGVVVTTRTLQPWLVTSIAPRAVVVIVIEPGASSAVADPRALPSPAADSLAYVLFTSGSTGQPKAVAVEHRSVVRLIYGLPNVPLGAGQTVLHLAPLGFDASTFEIWGPLVHGGCVVVAPDGVPTALEIGQLITSWRVTVLWLTAAFFNAIIDVDPDVLNGVEHLLVGGEALSPPHIARALDALPNTRLINGYGPTEATTFALCHPIRRDDVARHSIPIGQPLSNTRVYVVDADGQLAPAGMAGELWIGGDALARGYLNDPSATAQRFGPDPFAGAGRVYRTGDRVRLLSDGVIDVIGRFDDQIKVRGFRIEPAEVESAIERHPLVARAAVGARIAPSGDKTIVAYVVAKMRTRLDTHDLRRFLQDVLPAHMVPSQFVVVDALPLRPNGKIDRRALPALPDQPDRSDHAVREPRSDREARLSAIWRRVIGVDSVSIDDNFFELGGHSLMAVRLIAEIEKEFGIKLPLSSLLLEGGTIETQSTLLVDGARRSSWTPVVPIQPNGARPPFFLVHGIGGEVLSFAALAHHLGPDQPFFGLQVNSDEGAGFFSSVEQVASRYVAAIREVVPSGALRLGGYSLGGIIAYEMAQQLRAAGDEVSALVLLDCAAPVDIRTGQTGSRRKDYLHGLMYWLVDDDFLAVSPKEQLARLRSKLRLWRARAVAAIGRKPITTDVRDRLGLWEYPVGSQEALEAHFRMVRAYRPHRYPGSVTLLRARTMNIGLLGAPEDLGWHLLAEGVRVEVVPGAHDTIMREPRVRTLAAKLDAALKSVESSVSSGV